MRRLSSQPNQPPGHEKYNQNDSQNNKTIRGNFTTMLPVVTGVQERVCIPALDIVGQVCKAQV